MEISWIRNPRFKLYVFARMASMSETFQDVMNRIMDKGYLYDWQYKNSLNP